VLVRRQKAVAISFCHDPGSHEGLLFHSRLRTECAGDVVEIPHLVPLVGGEGNRFLRLGDESLHLRVATSSISFALA